MRFAYRHDNIDNPQDDQDASPEALEAGELTHFLSATVRNWTKQWRVDYTIDGQAIPRENLYIVLMSADIYTRIM